MVSVESVTHCVEDRFTKIESHTTARLEALVELYRSTSDSIMSSFKDLSTQLRDAIKCASSEQQAKHDEHSSVVKGTEQDFEQRLEDAIAEFQDSGIRRLDALESNCLPDLPERLSKDTLQAAAPSAT